MIANHLTNEKAPALLIKDAVIGRDKIGPPCPPCPFSPSGKNRSLKWGNRLAWGLIITALAFVAVHASGNYGDIPLGTGAWFIVFLVGMAITPYNQIMSGETDADSPLNQTLLDKIRTNFNYLADNTEGHSHDGSAIGEGPKIGYGGLNISTGNATGTLGASGTIDIAMNSYSFFPGVLSTACPNPRLGMAAKDTGVAEAYGVWKLVNATVGAEDYGIYWQYVAASDDPRIFVIADPVTGDIRHIWISEDPPANGTDCPITETDKDGKETPCVRAAFPSPPIIKALAAALDDQALSAAREIITVKAAYLVCKYGLGKEAAGTVEKMALSPSPAEALDWIQDLDTRWMDCLALHYLRRLALAHGPGGLGVMARQTFKADKGVLILK